MQRSPAHGLVGSDVRIGSRSWDRPDARRDARPGHDQGQVRGVRYIAHRRRERQRSTRRGSRPTWSARRFAGSRSGPRATDAIVPALQGALNEVAAAGSGRRHRRRQHQHLRRLLRRRARSGRSASTTGGFLSRHTWGMAHRHEHRPATRGRRADDELRVVRIFRKWGFAWGGNFIARRRHALRVGRRATATRSAYPSTLLPEHRAATAGARAHPSRRRRHRRCRSRASDSSPGPSRLGDARAARLQPWATVACGRERALRDHRRRPGRQHRGHVRGPPRRRGHDDRARHRRRRRPPLGLHPVEDDDRHRRGDELHPAHRRHGPRARSTAEVDIDGAEGPRRRHRRPAQHASIEQLLEQPGRAACCRASARLDGPHEVEVDDRRRRPRSSPADAVLIATGSRPRIPDWCQPDGDRILTTRDCYPPQDAPRAASIVIGSGVTGVEFVHMFSSLGVEGDAGRQPPAGAAEQGPRGGGGARGRLPASAGVKLLKGARAVAIDRDGRRGASCAATTAGSCRGQPRRAGHRLGAQHRGPRPRGGRRRGRRRRLRPDQPPLPVATCRTSTPPATSAGSCRCRRWRRCRAARSPST